jgi:hypothetical protein
MTAITPAERADPYAEARAALDRGCLTDAERAAHIVFLATAGRPVPDLFTAPRHEVPEK